MKESREPKHSALILAKHCADPSAFCQRLYMLAPQTAAWDLCVCVGGGGDKEAASLLFPGNLPWTVYLALTISFNFYFKIL